MNAGRGDLVLDDLLGAPLAFAFAFTFACHLAVTSPRGGSAAIRRRAASPPTAAPALRVYR